MDERQKQIRARGWLIALAEVLVVLFINAIVGDAGHNIFGSGWNLFMIAVILPTMTVIPYFIFSSAYFMPDEVKHLKSTIWFWLALALVWLIKVVPEMRRLGLNYIFSHGKLQAGFTQLAVAVTFVILAICLTIYAWREGKADKDN
jgi:hypothetical protein